MLLDLLIPTRCAACAAPGTSPCLACWQTFRRPDPLSVPAPLAGLHAPLSYEGAARELVARLKYRNDRGALPWLAEAMAAELPPAIANACVVTWAPTTGARRRERGFDHGELLARQVAAELGRPSECLLRRHPGRPQTGMTPLQRRANSPLFTAVRRPADCVVLVDDVVTTGTTIRAAATALREAGESTIVGLIAAATPLKRLSN